MRKIKNNLISKTPLQKMSFRVIIFAMRLRFSLAEQYEGSNYGSRFR